MLEIGEELLSSGFILNFSWQEKWSSGKKIVKQVSF